MTVPLVEANASEEMSTLSLEPDTDNYAEDDKVAEQVRDLYNIMFWTRNERSQLEEEWNAIRRMEMLRHDDGQKYKGRSNAYLPVYNRAVNVLVSGLSQGLFPSDDYFDISNPDPMADPERSRRVKAYLQWEFENMARLRTKIKPFLRQLVNLGTSALKFWYKTDLRYLKRAKFRKDVLNQLQRQTEYSAKKTYDGLCVSARNLFHTYVYPITADTPDEVQVTFEDIGVPKRFIEEMVRKARWVNGEQALNAPLAIQYLHNKQDLTRDLGGMSAPETSPVNGTFAELRMLTEVWVDLILPRGAYEEGEDYNAPVPCRVVMAGATPVEVRRNPFWHQKPPYLWSRLNVKPGFFYGDGHGRLHRYLQYLANDFINQTNDASIYGLNPMAKVNPGMLVGPLTPIRPGGVQQVSDMNAIEFFSPPNDITQYGIQMVNTIVAMAQDFGGAPPVMQGIGGSKAGKTATQSQILQQNSQGPLKNIVEDIELDVMVPLLKYTWSNCLQYRDPQVLAQLIGQDLILSEQDVDADYEFRWLASSQAVNQQVRSQQIMQLLQMVMPLTPAIQQQGMQIDVVPLLRRLYGDGFGLRGFDQFIKPAPPPPPPEMMGGPPGPGGPPPPGGPGMGPPPPPGMPPPGMEGGMRMRSATEQTPEGGLPPQPGEANDFMGVRNHADLLAALMGGNNNGGGH